MTTYRIILQTDKMTQKQKNNLLLTDKWTDTFYLSNM